MFICTDPLSAAVIKRFVHEHLRGMYRSTFSPSALIIASSSSRGVVERRTIARRARPRGRTPVHSIPFVRSRCLLVFIFPPLFVPITVQIHTSRIRMLYTPCIDITSHHSPRPHLWTSADARRAAVVTLRCRRVMSASCMSFRASVSGARVSVEVREWVRWIGEKNRRRSFARARRGGRREGRGKEDGWMPASRRRARGRR